jgi:putative ABC transport system ATP-binding protein
MSPIIQVRNLYKVYRSGQNKVYALNGVDFVIYRGEFCAIVGPSGSGKSTLLNMLAGLEKPTKGEIIIGKTHLENKSENELVAFRREHVGFIFQSYNLLPTMNALENAALPLVFRGMGRKKRNAAASKYLKLVGLEKQMKQPSTELSGGQQQRVGIARALAMSPQIIFADEPTGNLDSKTTLEVLHLMRRIVRDTKQTLVMVTHDPNIAAHADRRFHIVDGKIVRVDEGAAADEGAAVDEFDTEGRRSQGDCAVVNESAAADEGAAVDVQQGGESDKPRPDDDPVQTDDAVWSADAGSTKWGDLGGNAAVDAKSVVQAGSGMDDTKSAGRGEAQDDSFGENMVEDMS